MKRNEFIDVFARVSILSALALLVGVFAFRNKFSISSGCPLNSKCKECGELGGCNLPAARKERNHGRR